MNINISIDDVSPHPLSSVKVLDRCYELIKQFPDIKFSLFIPLAYWRTTRTDIATKYPLRIDAFPDFCKILANLPEKNFELCYHGLFHGIPGKSDNDEFKDIGKEEALNKFQTMFEIAKLSGLENLFKPIFRPPAWRMSPHAISVAKDVGIKILALSPDEYAKKTYLREDERFDKVVYYDVAPPIKNLPTSCTKDCLEVVYHACEWDKNYLSVSLSKEIENWLKFRNLNFRFIGDL